ncbi:restriction endonuclease subunit S [Aerococcus urinaeequi]|uniref:restriction endonuclease subunit S n=1 Tax=Aerococcus urinaeequi TaxID=51665 RepID=UPI003D6B8EE4
MGISKDSQKVPILRFKRFTDDWEQRKLINVVDRVTRRNTNLQSKTPLTISAQFGLVDQITYFSKQVASKNMENYFLLYNGDFAYNKSYSKGYPFGAIKRLDSYDSGALSTLYIVFRPTIVDSNFLVHYFETTKWYAEIIKISAEGARNHGLLNITPSDFFDIKLFIPSKSVEQEKIGTLINYVENTIRLHQRKLNQLIQLKEALLQKMFPGKGETVPKLRFAGFEGDWEERKLKNIGLIQTGNTPPTKNKDNYSDTGMLWVTPTDINYLIISDSKKKLSNIGIEKARIAKKGSILVTCIASIGKNALAMTDVGFNQQINSLTPKRGYDSYFLLTQSKIWSEKMKNNAASGTMQIVNKTDFSNIISSFPTSEEQQKIGSFFKHLDNTISGHQRKLDQLQNMKQVLLQNMFI